jgi:DNA-directed RNA polymerase specialized sigma24 family protein
VAHLVKKYGGTLEDAKDVFHDALLTWLELPDQQRAGVGNKTAYLCAIARNNWFRRIEKMERLKQAALLPEEDTFKISNELYNLLVTAGKKCMDLLQAFYYERRPAEEIATSLGLSGAHSASVQKYKCLSKLKDLVKSSHLRKEDFYEN